MQSLQGSPDTAETRITQVPVISEQTGPMGKGVGHFCPSPHPTPNPTLWVSWLQGNTTFCVFPEIAQHHCSQEQHCKSDGLSFLSWTYNRFSSPDSKGWMVHSPLLFFCEGDAVTFLPFLVVPTEDALLYTGPPTRPTVPVCGRWPAPRPGRRAAGQ